MAVTIPQTAEEAEALACRSQQGSDRARSGGRCPGLHRTVPALSNAHLVNAVCPRKLLRPGQARLVGHLARSRAQLCMASFSPLVRGEW